MFKSWAHEHQTVLSTITAFSTEMLIKVCVHGKEKKKKSLVRKSARSIEHDPIGKLFSGHTLTSISIIILFRLTRTGSVWADNPAFSGKTLYCFSVPNAVPDRQFPIQDSCHDLNRENPVRNWKNSQPNACLVRNISRSWQDYPVQVRSSEYKDLPKQETGILTLPGTDGKEYKVQCEDRRLNSYPYHSVATVMTVMIFLNI